MALHQLGVTAARALQTASLAHQPTMLEVEAGELVLALQTVRAVQVVEAMVAHKLAHKQLLVRQTQVAVAVVMEHTTLLERLAAQA
jgi:hypothetical protein